MNNHSEIEKKLEEILESYCDFPDEFDRHRCHKDIMNLLDTSVSAERTACAEIAARMNLSEYTDDGQWKITMVGESISKAILERNRQRKEK